MENHGTKRDLENMVDRVARELRFVMYGVPHQRPMDEDSHWPTYAKVAIRAMREPTVEMIDVADVILPDLPWREMIDEALK